MMMSINESNKTNWLLKQQLVFLIRKLFSVIGTFNCSKVKKNAIFLDI